MSAAASTLDQSLLTGTTVDRRTCAAFYDPKAWDKFLNVTGLLSGLGIVSIFTGLVTYLATEDMRKGNYSRMVDTASGLKLDNCPVLPILFITVASFATLDLARALTQKFFLSNNTLKGMDLLAKLVKAAGIWTTIKASQGAFNPHIGSFSGFPMLNAMFFASTSVEFLLAVTRLFKEPSRLKAIEVGLTTGLIAMGSTFLCAQKSYGFGFGAAGCLASLFALTIQQACCGRAGRIERLLSSKHSPSSVDTAEAARQAQGSDGLGGAPLALQAVTVEQSAALPAGASHSPSPRPSPSHSPSHSPRTATVAAPSAAAPSADGANGPAGIVPV